MIDRDQKLNFPYETRLFTPEDFIDSGIEVDAIVVTSPDYWEVYRALNERVSCDIISIDMLVIDIDLLDDFFRMERHISEAGARMYMMDMSCPLVRIKNPSLTEQSHCLSGSTNYRDTFGELRTEFLFPYYDDLDECSKEYIESVFSLPINIIMKEGLEIAADVELENISIVNGIRFTTCNPKAYDSTIHFYGDCRSVGLYTDDKNTIESLLQTKLNETPFSSKTYRVLNHVIGWSNLRYFIHVLNEKLKPGDIVVLITRDLFMQFYLDAGVISYVDILSAFDRPHTMGEIFFDEKHINHRGYRLLADKIYSIISGHHIDAHEYTGINYIKKGTLPKKRPQSASDIGENQQYNASLDDYISYLHNERIAIRGIIGAVVVNCNPFTLGHRYLIEQACSKCDFLYVFVVEEDKSFFPFSDRLELVRAGTRDLSNVKVIPGGKYIISTVTFPEYFTKESKTSVQVDASKDISIFLDSIVPALGITKRFLGEEPFDLVTNQYNQAIMEKFPEAGVLVTVIPRLTSNDGKPISASDVRELLNELDFTAISKLVPKTTLDYLTVNFREKQSLGKEV